MCLNLKLKTFQGVAKVDNALRPKGTPYDYTIPLVCGQCSLCKVRRTKEWIVRSHFEAFANPPSYALTLTYKENPFILQKKDVQDFIKRFRKQGFSFRFFCGAEYGSRYGRPHYHVILYGLTHDVAQYRDLYSNAIMLDLKLFENKPDGHHVYTSTVLNDLWKHGYVFVQEISTDPQLIAYLTAHNLKNETIKDSKFLKLYAVEKAFGAPLSEVKNWSLSHRDCKKLLSARRSAQESSWSSTSLGWQPFYDHYQRTDMSCPLSYCVHINGSIYNLPLSWLRKLIDLGHLEALIHYKTIIEELNSVPLDEALYLRQLKAKIVGNDKIYKSYFETVDNLVL